MPYGQTPARAPRGFLNGNRNLVLPELNTTSTDNLPSLLFPQRCVRGQEWDIGDGTISWTMSRIGKQR